MKRKPEKIHKNDSSKSEMPTYPEAAKPFFDLINRSIEEAEYVIHFQDEVWDDAETRGPEYKLELNQQEALEIESQIEELNRENVQLEIANAELAKNYDRLRIEQNELIAKLDLITSLNKCFEEYAIKKADLSARRKQRLSTEIDEISSRKLNVDNNKKSF